MHCCRIATPLKQSYDLGVRLRTLEGDLEQARAELDAHSRADAQQATAVHELQTRVQALEGQLSESRLVEQRLRGRDRELGLASEEIRTLEREVTSARQEMQALDSELAAFRGLSTLRLRDAVLRAPMVGSVLHAGARRVAKLLRD